MLLVCQGSQVGLAPLLLLDGVQRRVPLLPPAHHSILAPGDYEAPNLPSGRKEDVMNVAEEAEVIAVNDSSSNLCYGGHVWTWAGDLPDWPYDGMPCSCGAVKYDKRQALRDQIAELQRQLDVEQLRAEFEADSSV